MFSVTRLALRKKPRPAWVPGTRRTLQKRPPAPSDLELGDPLPTLTEVPLDVPENEEVPVPRSGTWMKMRAKTRRLLNQLDKGLRHHDPLDISTAYRRLPLPPTKDEYLRMLHWCAEHGLAGDAWELFEDMEAFGMADGDLDICYSLLWASLRGCVPQYIPLLLRQLYVAAPPGWDVGEWVDSERKKIMLYIIGVTLMHCEEHERFEVAATMLRFACEYELIDSDELHTPQLVSLREGLAADWTDDRWQLFLQRLTDTLRLGHAGVTTHTTRSSSPFVPYRPLPGFQPLPPQERRFPFMPLDITDQATLL